VNAHGPIRSNRMRRNIQGSMTSDYLTDADIRRTLVERADQFCALTKMSRTALGLAMLRDGYVITDIEEGRDIKLSTYNRAMTWLDAHWPNCTTKENA
jgi:hypothetical protein